MKTIDRIITGLAVAFVVCAFAYVSNEDYKDTVAAEAIEVQSEMDRAKYAKLNEESTAKWYRHMTWGEAYVPRELNAESVKSKVN